MSWRDLSVEEREDIRQKFSMERLDELLREIDELLKENEKANAQ